MSEEFCNQADNRGCRLSTETSSAHPMEELLPQLRSGVEVGVIGGASKLPLPCCMNIVEPGFFCVKGLSEERENRCVKVAAIMVGEVSTTYDHFINDFIVNFPDHGL